jgi:hypothetical protein
MSLAWFSEQTEIISLNSVNQSILLMEKHCVFFESGTEFFKCYLDELYASYLHNDIR